MSTSDNKEAEYFDKWKKIFTSDFFRTWKVWEHYEVLVMRSRGKTHPVETPTINNIQQQYAVSVSVWIGGWMDGL